MAHMPLPSRCPLLSLSVRCEAAAGGAPLCDNSKLLTFRRPSVEVFPLSSESPVFFFSLQVFGFRWTLRISPARMSPSTSPRFFTEREVARHCTKDSCWVLLGTRVYDVTAFLRMHPGGEALILRRSAKDVSQEMEGPPHRHSENARRWMEQYYIGEVDKGSGTDEAQVKLASKTRTRSPNI